MSKVHVFLKFSHAHGPYATRRALTSPPAGYRCAGGWNRTPLRKAVIESLYAVRTVGVLYCGSSKASESDTQTSNAAPR